MKKTLRDLLNASPLVRNVYGTSSLIIAGLGTDSRFVKKDYVFFARLGALQDGNKFVTHAIEKGATVIVSEELYSKVKLPPHARATYVQVSDINQVMAEMALRFYDTASLPMKLIGVTGTNGKTTTATFINEGLKAAGHKTLFVGTTGFEVCGKKIPTDFTTPPAPLLNELLRRAADEQATFAIMEISSHALKLKRVGGLQFDVAIFTNLTHEHLELHTSMTDYFETKAKLFDMLKPDGFALINADDPYGQQLLSKRTDVRFSGYGRSADGVRLGECHFDADRRLQTVQWLRQGQPHSFSTRMIGEYNAYNALAAYETLLRLGVPDEALRISFPKLPVVDGRFNWMRVGNFNVIIDFAHTPDGLEKILQETRKILPQGKRLITVFGCPGSRDASKRPMMGRIAAAISDHVIVTTDDIHHEEPQAIIHDIVAGLEQARYETVIDRREAIRKGLAVALEGDFVVIAGRGHEKFQYVGDQKIPFHDRSVMMEEAAKLKLNVEP